MDPLVTHNESLYLLDHNVSHSEHKILWYDQEPSFMKWIIVCGKPFWLKLIVFRFFLPHSILEISFLLAKVNEILGQSCDRKHFIHGKCHKLYFPDHSENCYQECHKCRDISFWNTSLWANIRLDRLLFIFLLITRSSSGFMNLCQFLIDSCQRGINMVFITQNHIF